MKVPPWFSYFWRFRWFRLINVDAHVAYWRMARCCLEKVMLVSRYCELLYWKNQQNKFIQRYFQRCLEQKWKFDYLRLFFHSFFHFVIFRAQYFGEDSKWPLSRNILPTNSENHVHSTHDTHNNVLAGDCVQKHGKTFNAIRKWMARTKESCRVIVYSPPQQSPLRTFWISVYMIFIECGFLTLWESCILCLVYGHLDCLPKILSLKWDKKKRKK